MIQTIIKRDGSKQEFSPSKINGWGIWASDNLGGGVDWSYVVAHTVSVLPKECTSKALQEQLIKTCLEQDSWSYNRMAGRLFASLTYKDLYGGDIPTIKEVHDNLVKAGLMEKMDYSDEDYEKVEKIINHTKDLSYAHYQIDHMRKKYSLKNRVTKEEYESPQFIMMRMAMALAEDEPKEFRLKEVEEWYEQFADNAINSPTPNYVNLGTPLRGYASCCVYTAGDNAKSLAVGDHIAYTMTCMSAGIGAHVNTRSVGDPVRGGVIQHQGKLPYYRSLVAATHANLQAGRGGASTIHYPIFDPEVDTISRLKNPLSTEDKKIRGADYSLQTNKFVARKVAKNEEMFMFTSFTAPDLYEAFYSGDEELFEELYEKYLNKKSFKKQWFKPRDVVLTALNEAYETGRAYLHFPDETNRHTPFKGKIYSSNLCQEIALPTAPYKRMEDLYSTNSDLDSEIGLCSLAALNVAKLTTDEQYEKAAYYALKMIDKVIHKGDYVFPHLELTAKSRLSAGVGIVGLAHYMAKSKLSYTSEEGKKEIHRLAERHAYFLIKASLKLGRELGNAPWMHKTKWPEGWLPIDTYNKSVDGIVGDELQYDWETLRQEIIDNGGIRNSVVSSIMPSESSSKATGTTNAIYPVRDLSLLKTDGGAVIQWSAPEGDRLAKWYEKAWDIPSKDMIDCYAIFQKFTDQGISGDLFRKIIGDDFVTSKEMLTDYLYMVKMGLKSRYYQNSLTSVGTELVENGGDEEDCESCKL